MSDEQRIGCLDAMVSTIRRFQQQPDESLRQSLAGAAREVIDDYFELSESTLAARHMLDDVSPDD